MKTTTLFLQSTKEHWLRAVVWTVFVGVLAIICMPPIPAAADHPNRGVVPVNKRAYGKTYGEWAAAWWQWVASIPLDMNPQIDETGEFCDIGQSGRVWFLGSTFGSGTFERCCTVPVGKAIFFPIVPAVFWVPEDGATEDEVRAAANAAMDGVDLLECSVDGVNLRDLFDYRAESPAFTLPDTLLIDFGLPPGDRFPAVSDGYWLLLRPLSRGQHVIHFRMRISEGPFAGNEHDVTYFLSVGSPLVSPNARFRGKSFNEWNVLWSQWQIGTGLGENDCSRDTVRGVRFLPGAFEAGDYDFDIRVRPGTAFVFPNFFLFGERYDDPNVPDDDPNDPIVALILETTYVETRLDGVCIRRGYANELDSFGPTYFDEPIYYAEPQPRGDNLNSIAALFTLGAGAIYHPMRSGEHTLETYINSEFFGVYHITHHIDVSRRHHGH